MRLMIRADDLGYSEAVNYGILKSVRDGAIQNIGVMVNMPYSVHGYHLIKDFHVCLGQHTNVCVGKPVSDPSLIPSIVNADGEFKTSKEYHQSKEDFVVLEEVIVEIEAQYQRFKEITGKDPEYFEGHAIASKNFFKGLEIVAKRHGLKYCGMSPLEPSGFVNGKKLYTMMESMLPNYDPFHSFLKMEENAHEDGYDLLVLHPGYLDDYIINHSTLTIPRTLEVEATIQIKKYVKEKGIHLYTYAEL